MLLIILCRWYLTMDVLIVKPYLILTGVKLGVKIRRERERDVQFWKSPVPIATLCF